MPILLRMALRNLTEHKGKTFIIGTIIALGVGVLLVGNALMDTAALGIERSFIDNYTAHIMISGTSEGAISLFGVQTVGGIDPTPTIPDYPRVFELVSQIPEVASFTPQLTGFGLLRREADESEDSEFGQDTRNSTFTLLFGIEPQTYQTTFSNIQLVQGRYLEPGEPGIMLSMDRLKELYKDSQRAKEEQERARLREEARTQDLETQEPSEQTNPSPRTSETTGDSAEPITQPGETEDDESSPLTDEELFAFLSVGDSIRVLGGFNQGLPRIRVIPVVGIYEQANEAQGVGSDLITFVDAQTLRSLLNLNLSAQEAVQLRDEETALLRSFDQFDGGIGGETTSDSFSESLFSDDLFGSTDELFSTSDFDAEDPFGLASLGLAVDGNQEPIEPEAGEPEVISIDPTLADPSRGAWHYLLIRLDQGNQANRIIAQLNRAFEDANIDAQAGNWEAAAGPFAQTADVIRTVFNIAIIIIGIVAILIMMNTMVISVIERTSEIGTMRALGAQAQTIRSLFLWETLVITTVFGVVGMALGLLTTGILNVIGIPATNTFLQVLFAGPVLRPQISLLSLVYSLGIVSGIGILAHLYPVSVAVTIPPVRAMQSE